MQGPVPFTAEVAQRQSELDLCPHDVMTPRVLRVFRGKVFANVLQDVLESRLVYPVDLSEVVMKQRLVLVVPHT